MNGSDISLAHTPKPFTTRFETRTRLPSFFFLLLHLDSLGFLVEHFHLPSHLFPPASRSPLHLNLGSIIPDSSSLYETSSKHLVTVLCCQVIMSSTIHPQYFCTRPNGTFTPLIAVDELPSHISIRGAPRVLAASETQGMTSLGIVQMRPQSYVVEGVGPASTRETSTSSTGHRTRDSDLQAALMRVLSDECLPTNERLAITTLIQHGLSRGMFTPSSSSNGWLVPNSGGSIAGNVGSRQVSPNM